MEKLKQEEGKASFHEQLQERQKTGNCDSVEAEWEALKKWLLESTEAAVGQKVGGKGKSWWGGEISQVIEAKKVAYKRWLASGKEEDKIVFRMKCKEAKIAVKEAKNGKGLEER